MGRVPTVSNDLVSLPPDPRWGRFGQALAAAFFGTGKTQAEAARVLGVSQATISEWKTGKAQPHEPELTFRLEEFLGLGPGALSKHLGYLPPTAAGPSWEDALARDPDIDDRLREVIVAVVRAMTKE